MMDDLLKGGENLPMSFLLGFYLELLFGGFLIGTPL
jgi:hypothetical protein